jgi:hypothetical protein
MPLRRIAFLIGSAESRHGRLDGVLQDKRRLKSFLLSPAGGAWRDPEIQLLDKPEADDLRRRLDAAAQQADFMLLHFGGHGCVYEGSDDTTICLNDKEEVTAGQLRTRISRQILFIDCCRKLIKRVALPEEVEKRAFAALDVTRQAAYVESCRAKYDAAIEAAELGYSVAFSCSVNEAANDDPSFTRGLIQCSDLWATVSRSQYTPQAQATLDLPSAVGVTTKWLGDNNIPQTPRLNIGRRIRSFPVAVA